MSLITITSGVGSGGLSIARSGEFRSSSPKELPLQALTEPDMNLSVHPALIIQPLTINRTSAQITAFDSF